jgi:hypothetical protein
MSGPDVRRDRALAIAAHVRRDPAHVGELLAEFDRRGDHPGLVVLALAYAIDCRMVIVEADRRVVAR